MVSETDAIARARRARFDVLADSYLRHILIILEANDRGASLRDFLDPWWSFMRGDPFINGVEHYSQRTMNNPCPCCEHRERLPRLDFVSAGAAAALERRVCKYKSRQGGNDTRAAEDRLIVDHSVPLAQICVALFDQRATWTLPSLQQFLQHHYKRGLLTRAEDNLLNERREGQSLSSKMPPGWSLGGDPFARYRARGIEAHTRELLPA